jgi:hypothetical protein
MRTAAIETFVTMRCNFLLGSLSNQWMAVAGTTPELADSPLCKPLVPMIEAALVGRHSFPCMLCTHPANAGYHQEWHEPCDPPERF